MGPAQAVIAASGVMIAFGLGLAAAEPPVFSKENLVAWCIVPYDAAGRGPLERARMLKGLGIRKFAYDWREKHIPTFDEELDVFSTGMDPANETNPRIILDLLARHKVKTQLWLSVGTPKEFVLLDQDEKVRTISKPVTWVAAEARKIGCRVALYNHGGWFGQPENQIAIIREMGTDNIGIAYNFHHGHEHIQRFQDLFKEMLPYLYALNLNGMKDSGEPKILDIGKGDREFEMIRVVQSSGYGGPIGILNHRETLDAAVGLQRNIEGLISVLRELKDWDALGTY